MQPGETVTMYYAPWCGYCKNDMKAFDTLAEKYKGGISFIKIDCEAQQVTGIDSFPTYIFTTADGAKIARAGSYGGDMAAMNAQIRTVFQIDEYERQQAIAAALAAQQAAQVNTALTSDSALTTTGSVAPSVPESFLSGNIGRTL